MVSTSPLPGTTFTGNQQTKAGLPMNNHDHTLDHSARAGFVADGCLTVRTTLPADFHSDLYGRIEEVFEKEGNPGNNLLPRLPEIRRVFDDPAVAGALESLLGPGYVMNPHRHCHLNPPGSPGQSWHKDCYVFDHNLRHPRFRWVLAFYYPQDVTADMGPTGVMPGQQWYRTISDPDPHKATEREEPLLGEAGTVAIVHFDSWHRAIANRSGRKRYMLKFQFARTVEPSASEADGRRSWEESGAVCSDVWRWLSGAGNGPAPGSHEPIGGWVDQLGSASPAERARAADRIALSGAAADAVSALAQALEDEAEPVRLNAAYALAGAEGGTGLLADSLRREAAASEELATAKTADNAHGTNPTAPRRRPRPGRDARGRRVRGRTAARRALAGAGLGGGSVGQHGAGGGAPCRRPVRGRRRRALVGAAQRPGGPRPAPRCGRRRAGGGHPLPPRRRLPGPPQRGDRPAPRSCSGGGDSAGPGGDAGGREPLQPLLRRRRPAAPGAGLAGGTGGPHGPPLHVALVSRHDPREPLLRTRPRGTGFSA